MLLEHSEEVEAASEELNNLSEEAMESNKIRKLLLEGILGEEDNHKIMIMTTAKRVKEAAD